MGPASFCLGFLMVEVDDIIEAGTDVHRAKMDQMAKQLRFGKIEDLFVNSSSYANRKIKQKEDFSFQVQMEEYVYTRLDPVSLSSRVLVKDAREGEKT